MNTRSLQTPLKLPFPQCVQSAEAAQLFQSNVIEQLFLQKLQEEDQKFQQERERNLNLKNCNISSSSIDVSSMSFLCSGYR